MPHAGPFPTSDWSFSALGGPSLNGPDGWVRVDRRTALLVLYLALEGPHSRAHLTQLLFPDVPERTGRGNLRQLLRRAGEATGEAVIVGSDPLAVSPALDVDVVRLRALARAEAHLRVIEFTGRVLPGLDTSGLNEVLVVWWQELSAEADRVRVRACHALADDAEREGRHADALEHLHRALGFDPADERAYRALMRRHYLAGDRAAAMAAFSRCIVALRDLLGVEPTPETRALADEIGRARTRPGARAPATLPLALQRPPQLIGREREWAAMEAAWAAGKGIVLAGPPGIGKTHLMQDFMRSHARPLYFGARPDDRAVPYGTHARTYRELVDAVGGPSALPAWVRRELARILPHLGDAPGPMQRDEERLRFWSAKVEAHRVAHAEGFDALGFDDLQYVDRASAAAGAYVLQQLGAASDTPVRTIHTYRVGELVPDMQAALHAWDSAGLILHLELEPLPPSAVAKLVESLGIPELRDLLPSLATSSAGVPLFVLETVKHVLETGDAPDDGRARGRTADVLRARLRRLSPPALLVARTLAVCRAPFTLELAAAVSETPLAHVVDAWTELLDARLVRDGGFSHDLLAESVAGDTPPPVAAMLHRRVAAYLEATHGAPGFIHTHWGAGGDSTRAAVAARDAERAARAAMLADEAADYFRVGNAVSTVAR